MTDRVELPPRGSYTLRARWLLPMAAHPVENVWLRIEHGRIAAIARQPVGPPQDCIDLGDAIILPGLVNAHTHLEFSAADSPLDTSGGLPCWIARVVAARRERPSGHESTIAAIRQGLAESAAGGVTTIGDIATVAPPNAYAGPGPRARVYREGLGLSHAARGMLSRSMASDLDRLGTYGIATGISPHAPYSVAARLGRALLDEAQRRQRPVAMHLLESDAEAELIACGTGRFRKMLDDLGVWDAADPPLLLSAADWITRLARCRRGMIVHATHIGADADALACLARHRSRLAVVICPRTTQAISGVLPPVRLLASAGIRIGIGTDSRASSPDLSVLAECRTLVDGGISSPEEALRMATVHAAWALAFEDRAGTIAVGRPADLAMLRPSSPEADPYASVLDPSTVVAATLRRGRLF